MQSQRRGLQKEGYLTRGERRVPLNLSDFTGGDDNSRAKKPGGFRGFSLPLFFRAAQTPHLSSPPAFLGQVVGGWLGGANAPGFPFLRHCPFGRAWELWASLKQVWQVMKSPRGLRSTLGFGGTSPQLALDCRIPQKTVFLNPTWSGPLFFFYGGDGGAWGVFRLDVEIGIDSQTPV